MDRLEILPLSQQRCGYCWMKEMWSKYGRGQKAGITTILLP